MLKKIFLQVWVPKSSSIRRATQMTFTSKICNLLRIALKRRRSLELCAPSTSTMSARNRRGWMTKKTTAAWQRVVLHSWLKNVMVRLAFTAISASAQSWSLLEPSPPTALCAKPKRRTISTESDGHPSQLSLKKFKFRTFQSKQVMNDLKLFIKIFR